MARYPIFVKRDLDGFFGLAIDNLVQILLIVALCGAFCGMGGSDSYLIRGRILPGVAVSLLIGNLFYALQAHWVARREGRSDVTALPYGINTPSLLVYIFFVMKPAYDRTGDPEFAWKLGLIACMGSGLIEFFGSFVAEKVRRNTPRAALLSTLAGIAITFISMTFALQIWQRPLVAMAPMAIVLLVYFAHVRFPLGLPGGLVALALGTALAWVLPMLGIPTGVAMDASAVREAWELRGQYLPQWVGPTLWYALRDDPAQALSLLSVIVPMGLFNVIGSLQNIESAEAGGDVFATGPSLMVNGLGTIAAAMFGSCFPTTIYIGHPGWKAMGARAGYSTLNGLFISAVCLTGTVSLISQVIPLEAGIAIVLWIGVVITAQAFQTSPLRHAPAAAIGLFPAIAAWGATLVAGAFIEADRRPDNYHLRAADTVSQIEQLAPGQPTTEPDLAPAVVDTGAGKAEITQHVAPPSATTTMQDLLQSKHPLLGSASAANGFLIHGLNILERGYIFTCMIIAAISAFLIDRRFFHAAGWSIAAALLTFLGLMHAYQMSGNVIDYWLIGTTPAAGSFTFHAFPLVAGYLVMAGIFIAMGYYTRRDTSATGEPLADARVVEDADAESH